MARFYIEMWMSNDSFLRLFKSNKSFDKECSATLNPEPGRVVFPGGANPFPSSRILTEALPSSCVYQFVLKKVMEPTFTHAAQTLVKR